MAATAVSTGGASSSATMDSINELRRSSQVLKDQIKRQRGLLNDTTMTQMAQNVEPLVPTAIASRRWLQGHLGKVYAVSWGSDSNLLASVGQDGKLIVWDAYTTYKLHAISLACPWVMTCSFSPDSRFVIAGGLDNACTLYNVQGPSTNRPDRKFSGHSGYIASCKFVSNTDFLSSSGDGSIMQWNVETGQAVRKFVDHTSDVMSVAVSPDRVVFASGSCDTTVKIWDFRTARCVQTFASAHTGDVNSVNFFPSGFAVASGSDDGTCRMFDLRADRELACYQHPDITGGVTSVAVSLGGRMLFAGYDDCSVRVWDTVRCQSVHRMDGHEHRVSGVALSPDGQCLASSSWDHSLRIWA